MGTRLQPTLLPRETYKAYHGPDNVHKKQGDVDSVTVEHDLDAMLCHSITLIIFDAKFNTGDKCAHWDAHLYDMVTDVDSDCVV